MPKKPSKPIKKPGSLTESTITQKEYQNYKKFKEQGKNMDESTVTKKEVEDYKKMVKEGFPKYKAGGKVSKSKKKKK